MALHLVYPKQTLGLAGRSREVVERLRLFASLSDRRTGSRYLVAWQHKLSLVVTDAEL